MKKVPPGVASAPESSAHVLAGPHAEGPRLAFVEDYQTAVAEAKSRRVPLFVDAWAPWCHTCLSLREFVLEDPSLVSLGAQFVFAAINTEEDKSQAFLAKFPQKNWPTLWVIDPTTEKPLLKWVGSLTVVELKRLLASVTDASGSGEASQALALLLQGQKSAAASEHAAAIDHYQQALKAAPKDWAERGMLVGALLSQLIAAERYKECAELARREVSGLPPGSAKADALGSGLRCALELPVPAKARAASAFVEIAQALLRDMKDTMLADDRSGLYESVVDALGSLGRTEEQKTAVKDWLGFLEAQAAAAKNAEERAVFDSHRLTAYLTLEQPEKAVQMLTERERELPADYNPPARLAKAYFEMKKLSEAEAAITRALKLAYGPRKLRLYLLKHQILTAAGRSADAKVTAVEAVEFGKGVSMPGSYAKVYDEIKALLSAPAMPAKELPTHPVPAAPPSKLAAPRKG
jgi:thioredoxin-like negative regulator of GroEL